MPKGIPKNKEQAFITRSKSQKAASVLRYARRNAMLLQPIQTPKYSINVNVKKSKTKRIQPIPVMFPSKARLPFFNVTKKTKKRIQPIPVMFPSKAQLPFFNVIKKTKKRIQPIPVMFPSKAQLPFFNAI